MSSRAVDVYLNDHLAGASFGCELAEQIRRRHEGDELGELMSSLSPEIEEDRQTLLRLMDGMGVARNPIKQATGWMAEKVSRMKFSGVASGEPDQAAFMALESLTIGVQGKACMWRALREVAGEHSALRAEQLDELASRAEHQREALEQARRNAGRHALAG
ncbi:MAG TPA: hypothetical protein VHX88_09520 [Solirubrobacteraceae bacterium]|nr:hypothetical protein [Solirubrobacteraceae bacterium]